MSRDEMYELDDPRGRKVAKRASKLNKKNHRNYA